jgi:hypothetical protein
VNSCLLPQIPSNPLYLLPIPTIDCCPCFLFHLEKFKQSKENLLCHLILNHCYHFLKLPVTPPLKKILIPFPTLFCNTGQNLLY